VRDRDEIWTQPEREQHARAVADLSVYVRQSHAERDLADLGRLAATGRADG